MDNQTSSPTLKETADILRVVLPKMGAHATCYEPSSYAVWYEYVRGGLPRLSKDVDAVLANRDRLTPDETRAIFETHLRDDSERAFSDARSKLAAMLVRMRSAIDVANDGSADFDTLLHEFSETLAQSAPADAMAQAVAQVSATTDRFRESMQALSSELVNNKAEVDRLTQELSRLREDVLTDPLTGLVNRRGFTSAISELVARVIDGDESFSLVMIDIDHFKRVNDTHGHVVGDRVLQKVAATMKSCVRGGDVCARYGGEEFALLLPGTASAGAKTVIEHVREALRRVQVPTLKPGVSVRQVTVSAGVTGFVRGESVEEFVRRADEALYASKNAGRDRVTVQG